jgi:pyruvate-formate lyase
LAKQASVKACPVETFDKEWGVGISGMTVDPSPFPRINAILKNTQKTTNGEVVPERAVILTEVYKKFLNYPQIIKCAEGMAAFLRRTPIYIYDHELIVGTLGCKKKAAPIFPEFGLDWLIGEMEDGLLGYSEQRTHDYFTNTDATYKQLKEIQEFWKGQCIEDVAVPMMSEDATKGSHMGKGLFLAPAYVFCGAGHLGINYDILFSKGYGGIKKEIQGKIAGLDQSLPEDIKKMNFYKAALIMTEAAEDYILRYADLALETAASTDDASRKVELEKIGANCKWISSNPPRTFWEAIQLVHMANSIVLMESSGHSISYGRFDQYMYPYYQSDIKNGIATRADMQELIENFQIKIWDMNKVRDHVSINIFANGGIGGPCLTLGGLKRDGSDGTNELSFMMLDAIAHTRIPNPWTAVRLHASTPWELKVKVANLIRLGTGEPKVFNDDITIPTMIANGRSVEDSRD